MDGAAEKLYPSAHFRYSPYAAVAQWIEYWPPKPRVVGSIPASRTIIPAFYIHSARNFSAEAHAVQAEASARLPYFSYAT